MFERKAVACHFSWRQNRLLFGPVSNTWSTDTRTRANAVFPYREIKTGEQHNICFDFFYFIVRPCIHLSNSRIWVLTAMQK